MVEPTVIVATNIAPESLDTAVEQRLLERRDPRVVLQSQRLRVLVLDVDEVQRAQLGRDHLQSIALNLAVS